MMWALNNIPVKIDEIMSMKNNFLFNILVKTSSLICCLI